jgi:hypothetical protein
LDDVLENKNCGARLGKNRTSSLALNISIFWMNKCPTSKTSMLINDITLASATIFIIRIFISEFHNDTSFLLVFIFIIPKKLGKVKLVLFIKKFAMGM